MLYRRLFKKPNVSSGQISNRNSRTKRNMSSGAGIDHRLQSSQLMIRTPMELQIRTQRELTRYEKKNNVMNYACYQKFYCNFYLGIQKNVWTNKLKKHSLNYIINIIPSNILDSLDTDLIEKCFLGNPIQFVLHDLPLSKITLTIILLHCLCHPQTICEEITCRSHIYHPHLLQSVGNVLLYVLEQFYHQMPWPISYNDITKYNGYVDPVNVMFLPGNHRASLPIIPKKTQKYIFNKLRLLPLNQMHSYGFTPELMRKLLMQKKKSIYIRLESYQELSIIEHHRNYVIVQAYDMPLYLLGRRRPSHDFPIYADILDISYDSFPNPLLILEQSKSKLGQKRYIKVDIPHGTNCYLYQNNRVCMNAVRIDLVAGYIMIYK